MSNRGPLAATDRRRQAGHKRPRHAGADSDSDSDRDHNGSAKSLAHLFNDRRHKNAEGKRAF